MHPKAHDQHQQQRDGSCGNTQQRSRAVCICHFSHHQYPLHSIQGEGRMSAVFLTDTGNMILVTSVLL